MLRRAAVVALTAALLSVATIPAAANVTTGVLPEADFLSASVEGSHCNGYWWFPWEQGEVTDINTDTDVGVGAALAAVGIAIAAYRWLEDNVEWEVRCYGSAEITGYCQGGLVARECSIEGRHHDNQQWKADDSCEYLIEDPLRPGCYVRLDTGTELIEVRRGTGNTGPDKVRACTDETARIANRVDDDPLIGTGGDGKYQLLEETQTESFHVCDDWDDMMKVRWEHGTLGAQVSI